MILITISHKMNQFFTFLLLGIAVPLYSQNVPYEKQNIYKTKFDDAIPVLNVATFHMGETSDANSTDFDENDKKKSV